MKAAEARTLAARTMRWGYFHCSDDVQIICPQCHRRIKVAHFAGRPQTQKLAPALTEHLLEECAAVMP